MPEEMIGMFDRSRRVRLLLIVLVMASVTIVTIDFRSKGNGPLDTLGHFAVTVLGPVQRGLATIFRPVGGFLTGFARVPSLQDKLGRMERENAALRAQGEQVGDIARENSNLRALLDMRERFNLRTIAGQVIGVGPSNFERSVFIDRGSDDGVRKGMPVVAGEGLVGRVTEVGPSTAHVTLMVDRDSAVAGRVAANGETGVLSGTGSGDLRFELLNPGAKVAVGDRVVTSGYDNGVYPPGIPVGTVTEAPPAHAELSRVVTVRPFVDFSSLDYVLFVVGQRSLPARRSPSPSPSPGASK